MTITEFLLARIAEDEAAAREATPSPWAFGGMANYYGPRDSRGIPTEHFTGVFAPREPPFSQPILALPESPRLGWLDAIHVARHDPARVLAECEAKRRIVEMHRPGGEHEPDACVLCQWDIDCEAPRASHQPGAGAFPCDTLRALASVYADHPDYRDEWRI